MPDDRSRSDALAPPGGTSRCGGRARDDEELIRGIAAGSEESFHAFFDRWAPRLGAFLARASGSAESGEDLLQEAFLRVLKAAPRFEARGSVGAWLYRICSNLAYSHWRRVRASPVVSVDLEIIASCFADGEDPETLGRRRAFADAARDAVARLPENHRLVFLLKTERGLTYEEIAAILRCPVGTAKSRFHHAVRKLRALLKDWKDEPQIERSHRHVL